MEEIRFFHEQMLHLRKKSQVTQGVRNNTYFDIRYLRWKVMCRHVLRKAILLAVCACVFSPGLGIELASGQDFDEPLKFPVAYDVAIGDTDMASPGRPAISSDGTNYLLVSCRSVGSSPGLFGVRLSGQGSILEEFQISNHNCSHPIRPTPSVSFDGTNYLVVFARNGQIFGTRVSPSGLVLDGPDGFQISTGDSSGYSSFRPAVAFDGTNYMVVWNKFIGSSDSPYAIYGAKVTPGGQALNERPILRFPRWPFYPSLAFDGTNYLVVWEDERSGSDASDIYGSRVTPEGVALDPEGIPISTAVGFQGEPHVVFDGTNYFVVWHDGRYNTTPYKLWYLDIYGARISKEGTLLDGPPDTGGIVINAPISNSAQTPRVSFDGTNNFIIWESAAPAGIFGARVSKTGLLIDGPADGAGIPISIPDPYTSGFYCPNVFFAGERFFIAWLKPSALKDIEGALIYPAYVNPGGDFWSMTLGNDWNYYGNDMNGGSWTYYRVIDEIDSATIPGVMTYVTQGNDNGGNRETIWFSISPSRLREWKEAVYDATKQEQMAVTFDEGLVWMRNPILVGDSWVTQTTGTAIVSGFYQPFPLSIPVNISMSVNVLSREYVAVPYGSYLAYKFQRTLSVWDFVYGLNEIATRYFWFVPYLGIVKVEDGFGATETLTSMNISRTGTFLDVSSSYFALSHIEAIAAEGITGGCSAGPPPQFCPDDSVTRGQMAVFIETSLGNPPNVCTGRFADVPVGHPFCGFIEKLAADGITGGCTATHFCPDAPVTRGQMAVFIEAALGNSADICMGRFADVPNGHPFCGFIERLAEDGITGGCGAGLFCPDNPVTRAQMAVFLVAAPMPLSP